jgi:hypothetical protein
MHSFNHREFLKLGVMIENRFAWLEGRRSLEALISLAFPGRLR